MVAPPMVTSGLVVSQAIQWIHFPRTGIRLDGLSHTHGPITKRCTGSQRIMLRPMSTKVRTPRSFNRIASRALGGTACYAGA